MLKTISLALLLAVMGHTQDIAQMDRVVQSFVSNNAFMGSVLVARGDHVLFSKGYGFANLEWNNPNAPDTKFRIGSITKQFTAASILMLEEAGRLNTGDPVKKFIPDAPVTWDKITLMHLLTHTSGIHDFVELPNIASLKPLLFTPEKVIALFRDMPLDFPPGEKWDYDNSGYVLLGYILEKVSGQSYAEFVEEHIFKPLGMKNSGYNSSNTIIPSRAAGYTRRAGTVGNATYYDGSLGFAAGNLYSTTEDLLRWERGLFDGKVLSASSLAKMTTPVKNDYGFGVYVRTVGGRRVIEHGGGLDGFNTFMAYYPDDKLTLVALGNLNGDAPDRIVARLAAVAHGENLTLPGERKEMTLDPTVLRRYVGAYRLPTGANVLITLENNQLFQRLSNQPMTPIFAESMTKFFLKQFDVQIEFVRPDAEGRPAELISYRDGQATTAKRLDEADAKRLLDAAALTAKRFKDQTPLPGSEATLRKLIEDLRLGTPDYTSMSFGFATATRQELPQLQETIVRLGPVQSVSFKGVGPAGADIYLVKFLKGSLEYRILIGTDGKVELANGRPQ